MTDENLTNLKGQFWGVIHTDWKEEAHARGRNEQEREECRTTPTSRRGLKRVVTGSVIQIASLNIRLGRAEGLEVALRELWQGKSGVVILQETKLTNSIHMRYSAGYLVWATEVEICHHGGIAVVWQEEAVWQVKGMPNFGPNVVNLLLALGSRRWYVVGAYVPPNGVPTVHQAE